MNFLRRVFSFPLLGKELRERAARRRTYWQRALVAALLYGGFWMVNESYLNAGKVSPMSALGVGGRMFESVQAFLYFAFAAFVPAMLCGSVTQEKERDSLVLLLLTHLRPWQIVVQKYLGGLIPALTFLLLAMPLAAVAYSYGGMTTRELALALLVMMLGVFQVGALALWCSCWFRKTVQSFLAAYILGGLFYMGPVLMLTLAKEFDWVDFDRDLVWWVSLHLPPLHLESMDARTTVLGVAGVWWRCGAIFLTTLVFLLAAVWHLPRRAFVPAKHRLRRFFSTWDWLAHRVNARAGGIVFGRARTDLPDDAPIVWRERRARALAKPEYIMRLSLALNVVVLAVAFVCLEFNEPRQDGLAALIAVLACGSVAVLATNATESMAGERANQTLDLVLSTPLSATQMVREKARALRPLALMLALPMVGVLGVEAYMEADYRDGAFWIDAGYGDQPSLSLLSGLLAIAIHLPLVTWIGLWMGMWCRSRLRAVVTTWIVLIAWCVVPLIVLDILEPPRPAQHWLGLLSPLYVPALGEEGGLADIDPHLPTWLPVLLNYGAYGAVALIIRRICLARADMYLRR